MAHRVLRFLGGLRALGLVILVLIAGCGADDAVTGSLAVPVERGADLVTPVWPSRSGTWFPDLAPRWWPVSAPSELEPTGIEVAARPGVQGMVVDGGGAVWLYGPWLVARVEPTTGEAQMWDISDDVAFAEFEMLRPASGPGVWLVSTDRLRLFDGVRFVYDVRVPAQYRGGPEGVVNDMVQVGSEVWVSSAAGVARCAGGAWSRVRPRQLDVATWLQVDSQGSVWATGRLVDDQGTSYGVMRFAGGRWERPDGDHSPTFAVDLVADSAGVVLARTGISVHRFEGRSWHQLPDIALTGFLGDWSHLGLGADAEGRTWLLGAEALARYDGPGGWRIVTRVEQPSLVDLAIVDGHVLVADGWGLLRLDGGELVRVWAAGDLAPMDPRAGTGSSSVGAVIPPGHPLSVSPDRLRIVSADELWATTAESASAFHSRAGRWDEVTLGSSLVGMHDLVLASDGALWLDVGAGLLRVAGDHQDLIRGARLHGALLPGPRGSVWVIPSASYGWFYAEGYADDSSPDARALSLVRPGGTSASIGLPGGVWALGATFAGADGTLWAVICNGGASPDCPTAPELVRWHGCWSAVPYPGSILQGVAAGADGGFWARVQVDASADAAPVLAHYAEGTWVALPQVGELGTLWPAPDGSVCGMDAAEPTLVCVDMSGEITRTPVGVRGEVRVGPDGSVWVADSGLVARVARSVPGGGRH